MGFLVLAVLYAAAGLIIPLTAVITALIIHELAHAAVAVFFRVRVTRVEVLPFGGQAVIEDIMALRPEKEIVVALAGPAISLLLAGVFYFYRDIPLISTFFYANLFLALFNLLPALPLDGGRFLRSALSTVFGFKRATAYIANLGIGLGAVLTAGGAVGVYYQQPMAVNPLVIGVVLILAAQREKRWFYYSFVRYLLGKQGILEKEGQVIAKTLLVRADAPVKKVLSHTTAHEYLVVLVGRENGELIGTVTEEQLVDLYINQGPRLRISDCLAAVNKEKTS